MQPWTQSVSCAKMWVQDPFNDHWCYIPSLASGPWPDSDNRGIDGSRHLPSVSVTHLNAFQSPTIILEPFRTVFGVLFPKLGRTDPRSPTKQLSDKISDDLGKSPDLYVFDQNYEHLALRRHRMLTPVTALPTIPQERKANSVSFVFAKKVVVRRVWSISASQSTNHHRWGSDLPWKSNYLASWKWNHTCFEPCARNRFGVTQGIGAAVYRFSINQIGCSLKVKTSALQIHGSASRTWSRIQNLTTAWCRNWSVLNPRFSDRRTDSQNVWCFKNVMSLLIRDDDNISGLARVHPVASRSGRLESILCGIMWVGVRA